MPTLEKSAGVQLELKDYSPGDRSAVIMFSVYGSIDRVGDIATQGMFAKSWQEKSTQQIDFLFNHMPGAIVGNIKRLWDDEKGAYAEVKFGNWTLGNDVMEMAGDNVLKGASFGYNTEKKDYVQKGNKKVRRLLEVKHGEVSLLTVLPAHPEAGIISLTKALEENDIDTLLQWNNEHIAEMKAYVQEVDTYCRKAKASDETIQTLANSLTEYKNIISQYDTAITQLIPEPVASDDEVKAMLLRMQIALTI